MESQKRFRTVAEYIESFPGDVGERLEKIRQIVKKVAPKVEEKIGYNMPEYKLNGLLLYFAAFKKHIGFYPMPSVIKVFQKEIAGYKNAKGSVQFSLDQPMPYELIEKIVKFRVKENLEKNEKSNYK